MTMNDSEQATNNDSHPAEDVATLKLQLELEKLDRQWVEEKQPYLPYEKVSVPLSLVLGFIMFAVPIVIIGMGLSIAKAERPDAGLVGMFAIGLGIFLLVGGVDERRVNLPTDPLIDPLRFFQPTTSLLFACIP